MAPERLSRNAPCPCGSGRKYKHCCYHKGFEFQQDEGAGVGLEADVVQREVESRLRPAEERRHLAGDRGRALAAVGQRPDLDRHAASLRQGGRVAACAVMRSK